MAQASLPGNEDERLEALYGYDLLDRDADPAFGAILRIAADVCGADISAIALIDRNREFFFARYGMEIRETPRAMAFCAHAIIEPFETFEIPDATKDPRFADDPLVTGDPGARFYAAEPLTTPDGLAIGGLCLFGRAPGTLDPVQRNTLKGLGQVIMSMFESRKSSLGSARLLVDAKGAAESALEHLKRGKAALSAQNAHFLSALDNMTQGLCMYDGDQRLIVSNKRYVEMHRLPPELVRPGTPLSRIVEYRIENGIFAGSDPQEYVQERAEWGRNPCEDYKIHEFSDGRIIAIARKPLPGGGWVATHEDITEQRRALKALRESERHFRNLIEGSLQGVFIARDWKLLFANQALADIFGYASPEEVLALQEVSPLLAPDERQRIWEYKTAREQDCPAPEVYESRGLRKDGTEFWIEFRVRKVDWRGAMAMQCVVLDIDDRKTAEAELRKHRDHLQEMVNEATADLKEKARELEAALAREKEFNELQRQFISMASHEFRTPLAIIDSTAQRLMKSGGMISGKDARDRIEKIRSAVQRMTRLMEGTLTAARLEEGKVAVEVHPCDIGKLVQEVCDRHQEFARDHAITCKTQDLPASISADVSALDQVLTNLLSNAIKYAPDAPDIEVIARGGDGHVVIQVRDEGIGIDEDDLPKMFGRFFRAKTSSGIAGTGIGLSLVKTLVEMHGGTVSVASRKGAGATFTIRLPVDGPGQAEQAA